jgi:hypothetical protein
MREDWLALTPPHRVSWEEEWVYLQALKLHPQMGKPWTHDALITTGARGDFAIVDLSDLRVPPGSNGPWDR